MSKLGTSGREWVAWTALHLLVPFFALSPPLTSRSPCHHHSPVMLHPNSIYAQYILGISIGALFFRFAVPPVARGTAHQYNASKLNEPFEARSWFDFRQAGLEEALKPLGCVGLNMEQKSGTPLLKAAQALRWPNFETRETRSIFRLIKG